VLLDLSSKGFSIVTVCFHVDSGCRFYFYFFVGCYFLFFFGIIKDEASRVTKHCNLMLPLTIIKDVVYPDCSKKNSVH